jgi:hypothetical protein
MTSDWVENSEYDIAILEKFIVYRYRKENDCLAANLDMKQIARACRFEIGDKETSRIVN